MEPHCQMQFCVIPMTLVAEGSYQSANVQSTNYPALVGRAVRYLGLDNKKKRIVPKP